MLLSRSRSRSKSGSLGSAEAAAPRPLEVALQVVEVGLLGDQIALAAAAAEERTPSPVALQQHRDAVVPAPDAGGPARQA